MEAKAIKLIVFCGVDGSGKSTMVNYLESRHILENAFYFRREKYEDGNLNIIKEFFPRKYHDGRDWRSGDFAKTVGMGIALDFIRFYHETIKKLSPNIEYIVCDRYTWCYLAYLRLQSFDQLIYPLFDQLRTPDITFYMDVGMDNLSERYKSRISVEDDEDLELMEMFHQSYKTVLNDSNTFFCEIDNSKDFVSTVDQVIKKLFEVGYINKGHRDDLNE